MLLLLAFAVSFAERNLVIMLLLFAFAVHHDPCIKDLVIMLLLFAFEFCSKDLVILLLFAFVCSLRSLQ